MEKRLRDMKKTGGNTIIRSVSFHSDGFTLWGDLHFPEKATKPPVIIGSHGLFATRQSPKQVALAEACSVLGMAYFRFDHRGCGQSEGGAVEQYSFEGRSRDLLNAFEYVRGRGDTGSAVGLFGSSLGGAAACRAFSAIKPEATVVFAAPTSSQTLFDYIGKHERLKTYPAFFYEKLSFDNCDLLQNLSNILIFQGELDEIVPVSEARTIYNAAGKPKKLIVQKQGDHRMSDEDDQEQFVRIAAEWFEKGFERKKRP